MMIFVFDFEAEAVLHSIDVNDIHVECSQVVPVMSDAAILICSVWSAVANSPKIRIIDAPEDGPLYLDTEDIEDAKDVEINNNAETISRRTGGIENKQERTKQNRSLIMQYEGVHLEKRQWVPQKDLSVAGLLLLQAEGSVKHVMMLSALTVNSNAGTTVLVQNR